MSATMDFWKRQPSFSRFKVWFWLSLGLHGVLLFLPLLPSPAPELPPEETIALTELPSPVSLPSPPADLADVPLPPAATLPSPIQPMPSVPPVARSPVVQPPVAPPVAQPAIVQPSPMPQVSSVASATPSPSPSSTVSPSPTLPLFDAVPPDLEAMVRSPTPADPLASFPHTASAEPCQGLQTCWRAAAPNWRTVVSDLTQQLETQGFVVTNVTERELGSDTGQRIYEVSKDHSVVYYLNFISVEGGLVYRITDEPMTLGDIENMAQS